jgi:hypothetical protein
MPALRRPPAIPVLGALNLCFGVLSGLSVVATFMMLLALTPGSPVFEFVLNNPSYHVWRVIEVSFGAITTVLLLASGLGLVRARLWARKLSIFYAWVASSLGAIGLIMHTLLFAGPLLTQAAALDTTQAASAVAAALGGVAVGFATVLYPLVLLLFMYRHNVIEYFDALARAARQAKE